jgi:glycosyltransferase involved in cell wall biosynthesis
MRISFITCTYNDSRYVNELLGILQKIAYPFAEILVIDDGSRQPYFIPPEINLQVHVVRLPQNLGISLSKRHGVKASTGDIVFYVDADVRPHPKWLKEALLQLMEKDVGLVGTTIAPRRGSSYLSKAYWHTAERITETCDVPFLAGGCLLFNRAV